MSSSINNHSSSSSSTSNASTSTFNTTDPIPDSRAAVPMKKLIPKSRPPIRYYSNTFYYSTEELDELLGEDDSKLDYLLAEMEWDSILDRREAERMQELANLEAEVRQIEKEASLETAANTSATLLNSSAKKAKKKKDSLEAVLRRRRTSSLLLLASSSSSKTKRHQQKPKKAEKKVRFASSPLVAVFDFEDENDAEKYGQEKNPSSASTFSSIWRHFTKGASRARKAVLLKGSRSHQTYTVNVVKSLQAYGNLS